MEKNLAIMGQHSLQAYASDLQNKLQFCKMLLWSAMCPKHFKTEGDVLSAILFGEELGFSPIQSLQSVYVVNGSPTLAALAIKAKIIESGGIFEQIQWDYNICKLKCTRAGWVQSFEFTMADAKQANLLGKDNWKSYPKDMLHARCIARVGKHMFADVLKGVECREEMLDAIEIKPPTSGEGESANFYYNIGLLDESTQEKAINFCKENNLIELSNFLYKSSSEVPRLERCKISKEQALDIHPMQEDALPGEVVEEKKPVPADRLASIKDRIKAKQVGVN